MALARRILAGAAATAALWCPHGVRAPEAAAQEAVGDERTGIFTLVVENDLFGQADQNYTNGVKLSYMTPAGAEPAWARRIADLTPPFADDLDVRFEFELGQTMYTPEDLTRTEPDPQDRPYAALLYGSVGMIADSDNRTLDQLQLLVGVVGPSALGGETQRTVHRALNAVVPQGWGAQIDDRPVAVARYQRTHLLLQDANSRDVEFDLAPHFGFSLGSLQTAASLGLGFRVGDNLPHDFGPPRIAPSLPGSGYFVPRAQWGWYAFGGVEARYVAYDVTLDERGANGAKVTREDVVGDAQLGLAVHFKDLRVAYTQVIRTREFEEQRDPHAEFGAVSITWRR